MLTPQNKRRRAVPGEAMKTEEILSELRQMGEGQRVAQLRRAGVASPAFGVALPALRSLARRIGHDHRLASELWREAVRETRILASLIEEPECVTETQMDQWAEAFDSWEICDQCCQNLFWRTRFALAKGLEWTQRPEEFVKRAGFVLVAVLARRGRQAQDSTFVDLLAPLIAAADDERAYVQKGASWALRQIGKRDDRLRKRVLAAVASDVDSDSRASRWVARDVSRELRLTPSPQG
jgi:3-methyladenine DNA glycosylase AlkD